MHKPFRKFTHRFNDREDETLDFHDYRGDRRTNFKGTYRQGGKAKVKDLAGALRSHLEDEDIDMGTASGKVYRKGKRNRGNNKQGGGPQGIAFGGRKLLEGVGWYRVTIPYGTKYEKSFILKTLLDGIAPLPFCPFAWQESGNAVVFYIDDYKSAEKLLSLDRKVQLPNGYKLLVRVYSGTPNVDLTPALKEKMKFAMEKRYNPINKALDLTKFHADPHLQDSFCALFKPIVFMAVIDIIEQNIPDLEAICLNDNKLTAFGFLKNIGKRLPKINVLHLGTNKIRDIVQLDAFIGLPVTDLLLDGNPLCDKYKEQSAYISDLKSKTKPKSQDGIELPPPISFDVEEEIAVPDPRQTFLCNNQGGDIVRQFLEQYFQFYDSKDRQPLLNAYHEQASFSYTTAYAYGCGKEKSVHRLDWYQTENRNVLRVQDADRRLKLLKQGRLSVVSFLQDMPETKHDIHSFSVDLTIFTPAMMCLTISGLFKELNGQKSPPIRHFFRTLVIVPAGTGFCIANEMYHVTNATPEQATTAFKTPTELPPVAVAAAGAAVVPTTSGISAPPSTPEDMDGNIRQEMIHQMALRTGMNVEWSEKCLDGNGWDFMRACTAFENLQQQGTIPAEAFIK